jgi:LuxR family transcriptional regulator, maltose regulon positive regulatory protein
MRGLPRWLILVCAPAGSGKTALLAAWASGCQWPVAGLSLDEGDNDPARTAVARRALRAP